MHVKQPAAGPRATIVGFTLKNTFAKVAVLTYGLGTFAHISALVTGRPGHLMPMVAHWAVVILAGYACWGYILFRNRIAFRNQSDKIVHWLILIHLATSALLHAYSLIWNTNEWLKVFSNTYSYIAVVYFIAFGYYSFLLDRRLSET